MAKNPKKFHSYSSSGFVIAVVVGVLRVRDLVVIVKLKLKVEEDGEDSTGDTGGETTTLRWV